MIIGLDIDNVISDFDGGMKPLFLKEDKNKRNTGVIDANLHYMKGMFDWSDEEVEEFLAVVCEDCAKRLRIRRGAREYINKLIQDGHEIVLITYRKEPNFLNGEKTTKDWLKAKKINYHKLVLSASPNKTEECRKNNIDIMFDDRAGYVYKMREEGVNCVLVLTKYNLKERKNLPHVGSWKELYNCVNNLSLR
ncbi:MAG: hypothetical protein E7339_05650 [Clostridiales bacterium]|nr:hypothetical protein [Clostridiales bacterium]